MLETGVYVLRLPVLNPNADGRKKSWVADKYFPAGKYYVKVSNDKASGNSYCYICTSSRSYARIEYVYKNGKACGWDNRAFDALAPNLVKTDDLTLKDILVLGEIETCMDNYHTVLFTLMLLVKSGKIKKEDVASSIAEMATLTEEQMDIVYTSMGFKEFVYAQS